MTSKPKIEPIDGWRADATNDQNLLGVAKAAWGTVGNKSDIILSVAICVALLIGFAFAQHNDLVADAPVIAASLNSWAGLVSNVAVSILGFLIAGFSIFATMTKPSIFRLLAMYKSGGRSISEFKFVFYNFLYIFVHYMVLLAFGIFVVFSTTNQSPIWFIADKLDPNPVIDIDMIAGFFASAFVSYVFFCILLLKSFVWNLYQAIVFAIFFDPQNSSGP